MYRVDNKNKKEYRRVTTKAKYFVVLSLFLLLLLVVVGSSAWNLHLRVIGFVGDNPEITNPVTIVSGTNANNLLLKYVDYSEFTETIEYNGKIYYTCTYNGNTHTPKIKNIEDDARDFDLTKFKYEYTCLYLPNNTTKGEWVAVNSQTTITAPKESGWYKVVITYSDLESDFNYSSYIGSATLYFAIQPKEIEVSVSRSESVYGDATRINEIEQTVASGVLCGADTVDSLNSTFSLQSRDNSLSQASEETNLYAGEYNIVGTDNSRNYAITFKPKIVEDGTYALYTITKRPITVQILDQISVYGDLPFDFANLDNLNNNKVAKISVNTLAYSDKVSDVISVSCGLTLLENEKTITSNVGEYPIVGININDNYEVTFANGSWTDSAECGTYTITKAPLNMTATSFKLTYGAEMPTYSVTYEGFKNGETKNVIVGNPSFTCTYVPNKQNGSVRTYSITPSLDEQTNYEINPIDGTLTVSKKALTITLDSKSTHYGEKAPAFTCTPTGFVYSESFTTYKSDFSLENYVTDDYTVGDSIGEYNIAWSILESELEYILTNYDCTLVANKLTVNARPISVTIDDKSSVYGANPVSLTATVAVTQGYTLTGNPIYGTDNPYTLSTSVTNTIGFGTYPIVGTRENSNYDITFVGTFEKNKGTYTVTKKAISIVWSNTSFTYDGSSHKPVATAGGLVNGDDCTINVSGEKTNAGSYIATAENVSNSNYILPTTNLTASFTIAPKDVTITWTNILFTYDGKYHKPTATAGGLVDGDDCTINVSGEKTNAGSYIATAENVSNSNYILPTTNLTASFTIAPKDVTITWTNILFTYDGKYHKPTATAGGLVDGDDCTINVSGEQINANTDSNPTYTATASIVKGEVIDNNYKIIERGTQNFTIEKAPLTITAEDKTTLVGVEPPEFTVKYDGFVNGETQSVLGGELTFAAIDSSITATAGEYVDVIVPMGLTSDNYDISFVSGKLTVVNGFEKPTIGNNSFVYNGTTIEYLPDGFDPIKMAISGNSATDANTYTATVTPLNGAVWADYTSTALTFEWTITQATTVISGNLSIDNWTYGGTASTPSGLSTNFGDIQYQYSSEQNGTYSTTQPSNAGNYYVKGVVVGNDNYTSAETAPVAFTIEKAIIDKPTEGNSTFNYDGTEKTYTPEGFNPNTMVITNVNQTNSGNYRSVVTPQDNYKWADDAEVAFIWHITKKEIDITNKTIEIVYSTDKRTWQSIEEYIRAQLVVSDKCGSDDVYVNTGNLTNGIITYTYNGSTYSGKVEQSYGSDMGLNDSYLKNQFVGSTYIGTSLSLGGVAKNNYSIKGDRYYFKYKTASVGGTYYTIEDAIHDGTTNTITFPGDASTATSYVLTCFSNIELPNEETLSSNSTLNAFFANYKSKSHEISGRTLLVPYENSENVIKGEKNPSNVSNVKLNVYSALIIPSGISITFKNSASLKVGSHITAPENGFATQNPTPNNQSGIREHGVIVNDGKLTFESGTSIYSYGYIKSSSITSQGSIIAQSGVQVREYMYIHSWPGGTAASAIYSKVFPTNAWSLHNISCTIQINAGAQYYAYAAVTASIIGYTKAEALVIGKQGDTNCIFIPDYDKANYNQNSYIIKSTKPAASWSSTSAEYKQLYNIVGANYLSGQKDIIEIYGDYTDRTLLVDVGAKLKTSTEISAPLGYMDVTIDNGSTLNLINSDYLFLPGTKLFVEKGANLIINNEVDVVFLDYNTLKSHGGNGFKFDTFCKDKVDAYAVINGNIEIYGRIGGKITSTEEGASMVFHTIQVGANYNLMKSSDEPRYIVGEKYRATANVLGVDNTILTSGRYCTATIDNAITWMATTGTIVFDQNYGDNSVIKSMENIDMPYTLNVADYPSNPTRALYSLDVDGNGNTQWYLDKECSQPIAPETILYAGTTLYAKWIPISYKVNYQYVYGTNVTEADVGLDNPIDDLYITAESGIIINSLLNIDDIDKTVEGYSLTGWYVDSDCRTNVDNAFELLSASSSLTESTITVYGKWDVYVPSFKVEYSTGVGVAPAAMDYSTDIVLIESQEGWQPSKNGSSFDRDTAVDYYFDGWYIDENCTTSFTSFSGVNMNETQHLYAKWTKKNILNICISDGSVYDTRRYKPGTTFTIPALPPVIVPKEGQYIYWTLNGATDSSQGELVADSQCTLVDSTKVVLHILDRYEITTSLTNSSVIIYYSGHYSINGSDVEYSETYSITSKTNQDPCFYAYSDGQITNIDVTWKQTDSRTLTVNGANYDDNSNATIKISAKTTIVASSSGVCLAEGTLITLADGTQKKVEDLNYDDVLLAFNHVTGQYEASPLLVNLHAQESSRLCRIIYLDFSDGTRIGIIGEHSFFDIDENKYVYIDEDTVKNHIGHRFVKVKQIDGRFVSEEVVLNEYNIVEKTMRVFSPVSGQINVVTEGLLSFTEVLTAEGPTHGVINIFEFGENLKYDEVKMQEDIDKYGLYTYDDYKAYLTYEEFISFPWAYFKVSVGKGRLTWDDILWNIQYIHNDRMEQMGMTQENQTTSGEVVNSEQNNTPQNSDTTNENPFETVALPPPTTSTSSGSGGDSDNSNDGES